MSLSKTWLGLPDVDVEAGVYVEGYPIECDWCGEHSVHGRLVLGDDGMVELWEDCETCTVRTRIGGIQ